MMTAELKWSYDVVYLIYEITERKNSYTERKTEECFSAEDNWVLFKKRRL